MKYPKTPEDVESEIYLCSDHHADQRLRQFLHILPTVQHDIIVEGVIRVFENSSTRLKYRDLECAGKILATIKPTTDKDLMEILQRTLTMWDKSIEELPFWLRDTYGLPKVQEVLNEIEQQGVETDKIRTMKWWLQIL